MWVITGGAGFIGSALIWELNRHDIEDILVVDRLGSSDKWKNLRARHFADYLEADEFLARLTGNQIPNIQGIVHLGACSSTTETNAAYLIHNNYEYTKALAGWSLEHKVRFVYASSGATYGDGKAGYRTDAATTRKLRPLNMYGYSKQLFDLWALHNDVINQMVGVKFFNIYGPNEYHKGDMRSVVAKAFEQIQKDGKAKLFKSYRPGCPDGEQMRDFLYIKDAVRVLYAFMTRPTFKGLFNLGSGKARTWNDLVKAIFAALGKPVKIEFIDMPEFLRPRYQYHTEADMTWHAYEEETLPFSPLEEGVRDYVQNHLTQPDSYL